MTSLFSKKSQDDLFSSLVKQFEIEKLQKEIEEKQKSLADDIFNFICSATNVKIGDIVAITLKDKKVVHALLEGRNSKGGFKLTPFYLEGMVLDDNSHDFINLNSKVGEDGFVLSNPKDYSVAGELLNDNLLETFDQIPKHLINLGGKLLDFSKKENTFHNPSVIRSIGKLGEGDFATYSKASDLRK